MSIAATEPLIDLDPQPGKGTLLRHRANTPADIKKAITNGRIAGFVYSFLAGIVAIIYGAIVPEDHPLVHAWLFWLILLIFMILAIYLGGRLRLQSLERETRKGFLRIDPDEINYWTSRGPKTIDMARLFGAGPEEIYQDHGLRLCYRESSERGYISLLRNFRDYEVMEGPIADLTPTAQDGNALAREVIIHYINQRRASGKPVAELPPYAFVSKRQHHKHMVFGEHVLDASVECDGKTLSIFTKGEAHSFPATAVKEVWINKHVVKGVPREWDVTLTLDSAYGEDTLELDLMNMTKNEEVEQYLVCLPVLFPASR